jgi:hypothetical protein
MAALSHYPALDRKAELAAHVVHECDQRAPRETLTGPEPRTFATGGRSPEDVRMSLSRSLLFLGLGTLLVAGLAAACGDDDDDTTSTATSSGDGSVTATAPAGTATGSETPGATSTATSAPTEEQIPFETPATVFSKEPPGIEPPLVVDIRAARNEGFDRVVFEFDGDEMPGYEVAYVDGVTECGSGAPVELVGEAFVSVTIRPANAHDEGGNVTVPRDVPTEGTAAVREVRNFCDFEAVVGYGISLAGVRPYRVFELEGPTRLVIDFSQ